MTKASGVSLDLRQMDEVLRAEGIHELLDRWDRRLADAAPDDDRRPILAALRQSASALEEDPDQLPGQLLARLTDDRGGAVAEVIAQAQRWDREPWLRPLTAGLAPSGSPLVMSMQGHADQVTAVAITPDGRRAVSGSVPRTLMLWDLERGTEVRTLHGSGRFGPGEGYGLDVNALAIGEDGLRAGSVNGDGRIHVWDLSDGSELHATGGFAGDDEDWLGAITIDGRRAACIFESSIISSVTADQRGRIEVFDLDTGEVIRTLEHPDGWCSALALSADGSTLLTSALGLRLVDLGDDTVTSLDGPVAVQGALAATPDVRTVVSGHGDGAVAVWRPETGESPTMLGGHTGSVNAVAITPDGRRAVSGSDDSSVRLWDLDAMKQIGRLSGHAGAVLAVAITPDGRWAVSGGEDRVVRLWDLATATDQPEPPHHLAVQKIVVSALGRRAVVTSVDGTSEVWDLDDDGDSPSDSIADEFPPEVSVSGELRDRVEALERGRGSPSGLEVQAVVATPDGQRAVCITHAWNVVSGIHRWVVDRRTVRLWDLGLEPVGRVLAEHSANVVGFQRAEWFNDVAVSADGRFAVGVGQDRRIILWDLNAASTVATFTADSAPGTCAISADGHTVAAGSSNGDVVVLRLTAWPER